MSRRRARPRRLPTRRLVYLAVLVGAALVGSAFARVTSQDNALERQKLALSAEIALREAEQSYLRAQIAMRETPDYVVEKARELGYVKAGEGLASVRDAGPSQAGAPRPVDARDALTARAQRWISLFFHP